MHHDTGAWSAATLRAGVPAKVERDPRTSYTLSDSGHCSATHLRRRRSGLAAGNPDGVNRQLITTKHVLIFCCLILPFAFGAVLILMELISPGSTSVQGGVGGGGN